MKRCKNRLASVARLSAYQRRQRQRMQRELELLRATMTAVLQVDELSLVLSMSHGRHFEKAA